MIDHGRLIARAALEIKAVKLNPNEPFEWDSGYTMPIHNNNGRFLYSPYYRKLIAEGFVQLLSFNGIPHDIIAGTSRAGISPATTLADLLKLPIIYVKGAQKNHGLKRQIEGIDSESDLEARNVVLIEDLISTGETSAAAVQAIRDASGNCDFCLSIFNYGFSEAEEVFQGKIAYDREGNVLTKPCRVRSLYSYDILLEIGRETGYINDKQAAMLAEWRADPFNWGEKHGFPRIKK